MSVHPDQVKPNRKSALTGGAALFVFLGFIVFLAVFAGDTSLLWKLGAVGLLSAGILASFLWSVLGRGDSPTPRGRELRIERGRVAQVEGTKVVASIDATKPFAYSILDRHIATDSQFRLYQGRVELTFFNSDPGGDAVVRDVIQISWPPPSRGASRSVGPSWVDGLSAQADAPPGPKQARWLEALTLLVVAGAFAIAFVVLWR